MKRRNFLCALGASVAWPHAAHAQAAVPVIGLLSSTSPNSNPDAMRAFHQGLKESGYVEGENVATVYRWGENQVDRMPELAVDLVQRRVAVIVSLAGAAFAAKAATTTIPIVFLTNEDPVRLGLVASLARPGGNLTGVNFVSAELVAKRLELLRELVPAAKRVAVLINPSGFATEITLRDAEPAARSMGLQLQFLNAATGSEIDATYATLGRERPDAVFVASNPYFTIRRVQLSLQAMRLALPATYPGRQYAEVGGLMSYGGDLTDAYRQVGVHVGRILKGAKPADMPVVQATKFELVINAQTARMLGLTVSPSLLARADEVIE